MKNLTAVAAAALFLTAKVAFAQMTLEDVQLHNNKTDCWTVFGKNVYNLTDFIYSHPSRAIRAACGIDGKWWQCLLRLANNNVL